MQRLDRHRPDADQRPQGARLSPVGVGQPHARAGDPAGLPGDLRVDRLPRRDRGGLRPDHRGGLGPAVQPGLLRRLQPRAHQPRRQGAPTAHDQESHIRLDAGGGRLRRRPLPQHHPRRDPQGEQHPRGRGGQGDREHPARRQHRADQRAGAHLQPARHRHRGGPRRGREQVELPPLPSRPGGRALYRGRPLLPHPQGAGDRLPPGDHPRRAAAERQHGGLRGEPGNQAHDAARHAARWEPRPGARAHLQGELPGSAQHPGGRHRPRAYGLRHRRRRPRSLGQPRRGRGRVRHPPHSRARPRDLRRGDPGRRPSPVPRPGPRAYPRLRQARRRALRRQAGPVDGRL